MAKKYIVTLSPAERETLQKMIHAGTARARQLTHARILLKADEHWTDEAISAALDVSVATIERVRQDFVEQGLPVALNRRPPTREYRHKLDGEQEAHLIALACSTPPAGRSHWSMRLLADRMVQLEYVDRVSHETVRQVLNQNELKPWQKQEWCIPPEADADFVYHMEDVLTVYKRPADPEFPIVCFDETPQQLVSEMRQPLPPEPGQPERYDYEYRREGVANLFLFFAPLQNWRHLTVTDHRTKADWAECMRELVDELFPKAKIITVIQDQLNTHNPAALYEVFLPAEAKRILDRLEFHYTPKHGSWLNMAEIEFSVLSRQGLEQRIPDRTTLAQVVAAWEAERNTNGATVHWRFTTEDARIKLGRLYPSIQP